MQKALLTLGMITILISFIPFVSYGAPIIGGLCMVAAIILLRKKRSKMVIAGLVTSSIGMFLGIVTSILFTISGLSYLVAKQVEVMAAPPNSPAQKQQANLSTALTIRNAVKNTTITVSITEIDKAAKDEIEHNSENITSYISRNIRQKKYQAADLDPNHESVKVIILKGINSNIGYKGRIRTVEIKYSE